MKPKGLYEEILERSKEVDKRFEGLLEGDIDSLKIIFKVPNFHPRAKHISSYVLSSLKLEELRKNKLYKSSKKKIFLVDRSAGESKFVKDFLKKERSKVIVLRSIESKVKTKEFLDELIRRDKVINSKPDLICVIGGGLILNVGAYIAENLSTGLILFPTTVLSMSDSSGGKVRVNKLTSERAYKHYYKSFYEPNSIFIDKRFLNSLPEKQIKIGLAEIIKHGLFQSQGLYDYLNKHGKALFKDKEKLLGAALWAADLKRICIEIDVEENENGSRRILRAGHNISDRLEEDKRLKIPHGLAVAIGIVRELELNGDRKTLKRTKKIFKKFEIPYRLK